MKRMYPFFEHVLLLSIVLITLFPLYLALVVASHDGSAIMQSSLPILPGRLLLTNMKTVLTEGMKAVTGEPVWYLLVNSFITAFLIAIGKILLALWSAFALVYFKFPWKKCFFSLIIATMMLPVEVRILPTFQVVASLNWLNTFYGLTFPLMVSATGIFLFRQFFQTLPSELVDAAQLDGAGPWRFFCDILLPLAKTPMAALFIILFVYGWNQYLWPLVITTDPAKATIVMGIRYLAGVADQVPEWHYIMCVALLAMCPPCLVVIGFKHWFEKGLIP